MSRSNIEFIKNPEITAYEETPGICQHCKSENVRLDISNTEFDGRNKIVSEEYVCEDCGCKYTEIYIMKLKEITISSMG